jgi:hypothetical protein
MVYRTQTLSALHQLYDDIFFLYTYISRMA